MQPLPRRHPTHPTPPKESRDQFPFPFSPPAKKPGDRGRQIEYYRGILLFSMDPQESMRSQDASWLERDRLQIRSARNSSITRKKEVRRDHDSAFSYSFSFLHLFLFASFARVRERQITKVMGSDCSGVSTLYFWAPIFRRVLHAQMLSYHLRSNRPKERGKENI